MAADIIGKEYNLERRTTNMSQSSKSSSSYISCVAVALLIVTGLFIYGGGDLKRDLPLLINKSIKG